MNRAWLAWLLVVIPVYGQTAADLAAAGAQHLEANRGAEAQVSFAASLRLNPKEFEALTGMGFLSYSQGDFAGARGYLERAIAVRPQAFQARFLLGAVLVQMRESKAAIVHLRQATAVNPKHADARKLLAAQYVELRQFRDAMALLQPIVNSPPFDEETHLLLIEARQTSGDAAGAYALARTAAQRFPESAQVLAWLGFQLQFSGRYEEAKAPLRRAIALDADYPIPLQILGDVYLKQENYPEATTWLSRAAGQMPADIETLLALGRAQAGAGDTAASLTTLRGAAAVAPSDARVHLQLSRLYFAMGDEASARREADISVSLRDANPAAAGAPPPTPRRR